tara:strand:- start:24767 stop:26071 length:1305 start_codon:yes stop_codon:yes gene_type:complete
MFANRLYNNLFKRNFNEIKKGGVSIFIRKSFTLFKIIFLLPLYVPSTLFFLIIYLLKPLILIRFVNLQSSRIGHFLANTELFLCEKEFGINKSKNLIIDIFFFKDACNKQVAKMWRRKLLILPNFIIKPTFNLIKIFSLLFPSLKIHIASSVQEDRDIFNLIDKVSPHIDFTIDEIEKGQKFLNKFGLTKKSKFVCLIVRDDAYLKDRYPEKNWSYHSYRNYNIENFYDAANALTERGYFVFRMGSKVEKQFNNKNKMIIDYANLPDRSDFLDIYLGAKCDFCISTSCGFDAIPFVFRRPIAYITVPIQNFFTNSNNFLIMTKHHFSKELNRRLKFSEILELGLINCQNSKDYQDKNIDLIENSSEEIKDFVIEMMDRYENKWIENDENLKIQEKFWKNYKDNLFKNKNIKKLHGKLLAKMSVVFLKKNTEWLL